MPASLKEDGTASCALQGGRPSKLGLEEGRSSKLLLEEAGSWPKEAGVSRRKPASSGPGEGAGVSRRKPAPSAKAGFCRCKPAPFGQNRSRLWPV